MGGWRKVSISHPDPILRYPKRLETAQQFFGWLDEITIGQWEILKPKDKLKRKYVEVIAYASPDMLQKLQMWKRLADAELRVGATFMKAEDRVIFRLRFDCFECARAFAGAVDKRWKKDA